VPARPFAEVDVFAAESFRGNPVAVVLDGEGLDEAGMQQVANWTNLSETTFVLPPTSPEADYRVRIFTPSVELPFAGHPTLGTAHAWLASAGEAGADRVVQECGAGLVEIRRTPEGLAFAAPPLIRSGPVDPELLDRVVAALGLERDEVLDAQWVDNGPGWLAVLLASAERVLAIEPGPTDLDDISAVGFHPPGAPEAIEVRAFFRAAAALGEDPVTGSLNAALAGWLLGSGRLTAPYVARQGTALGRAGRVYISQDPDGQIWVAGATTTLVEGTIAV
jgi:PhzF family phenazine biosynthesis protein